MSACGPGEEDGGDGGTPDTAPVITTQPVGGASDGDTPYVLRVVASGGGLGYQWYRGAEAVKDATGPSLSTTTAGSYTVAVRNTLGEVRSAAAVVTVSVDPVIVVQPMAAAVTSGRQARLAVVATGQGLSYQWYGAGTAISGATGASLQVAMAGSYHVVVGSSREGAASVTSTAAVVSISTATVAPGISAQPVATTVTAGRMAWFAVMATGTDLQYSWYRDGVAIAGANAPAYVLASAAASNQGRYHVVVSNAAGLASSTPVALTVLAPGGQGSAATVAAAAQSFLDLLPSSQKTLAQSSFSTTTVLFPDTAENARAWSGLPGTRHGLRLNRETMTSAQLAAADRLISAALSAEGATQVSEIRLADDVQAARARDTLTYGTGNYSIAILGQPSATAPWALQISGHNLAHNLAYNAPQASATPMLLGSQPPHWTLSSAGSYNITNTAGASGTPHAPLQAQRAAAAALASAVLADTGSAEAARLPQPLTQLLKAPDTSSDNAQSVPYPSGTLSRGVRVSALNATQRAAVQAVVEAWVKNAPADVAATLLAAYLAGDALDATYVGYAPGAGGSPDFSEYPNASALPGSAAGSYLRIDGPRVWIELLVRPEAEGLSSIVYAQGVWRDKLADYGGRS